MLRSACSVERRGGRLAESVLRRMYTCFIVHSWVFEVTGRSPHPVPERRGSVCIKLIVSTPHTWVD
jgi:hypothetical protein